MSCRKSLAAYCAYSDPCTLLLVCSEDVGSVVLVQGSDISFIVDKIAFAVVTLILKRFSKSTFFFLLVVDHFLLESCSWLHCSKMR